MATGSLVRTLYLYIGVAHRCTDQYSSLGFVTLPAVVSEADQRQKRLSPKGAPLKTAVSTAADRAKAPAISRNLKWKRIFASLMEFTEFLSSKKIDPAALAAAEPALFAEWATLYEAMSTASFVQQKLFLINGLRRRFPLSTPTETAPKKAALKPKINIPKR